MTQPAASRRDEARLLNQLIDRALLQPSTQHRGELLALARQHATQRLAERVRQRATRLGRHTPEHAQRLLSNRDELIMALYAGATPEGWANAWCDGSSSRQASERHAAVGVVLMDVGGKCISQTSRYVGGKSAFEAELTALKAAMDIALAHNIERLRVHTDSKALVQLWHERWDDPRLTDVRLLGARFRGLHIRAIPRLHNQVANALARRARSEQLAH